MCLLDSIKKYRSTDSNTGNIVFIGDPLVGKTSLINLLTCRNKFTDNYLQTKCIRFINHNFLTYIDYPGFDSAYYHMNPMKVIEARIEEMGYRHWRKIISPHNYGTCQIRKRVYIVCIRKDLVQDFEFTFPKERNSDLDIRTVLDEEADEK